MNSLSNHFADVKLFEFDPSKRGPFFVLQKGFAPDDASFEVKDWILCRDGVWEPVPKNIDPKKFQFTSDAEVIELLSRLPARVVCRIEKE